MRIVKIKSRYRSYPLEAYKVYHKLEELINKSQVSTLNFGQILKKNKNKLWMINSTETGGGVAEMLPKLITLIRELGIPTEWAVIETKKAAFFNLTKSLHNLIHGKEVKNNFSDEDRAIYESVNKQNLKEFLPHVSDGDIVVVHDPQPLALGHFLKKKKNIHLIWRSHIGVEFDNNSTKIVWDFLKPYFDEYDHGIFTCKEYIPKVFPKKTSIITPGINPYSHKNRSLSMEKLIGILSSAGLFQTDVTIYKPFTEPIMFLNDAGEFTPEANIKLLGHPVITEISRWDSLKGFSEVLVAFSLLKQRLADGQLSKLTPLQTKTIESAKLCLAGPSPDSVADDPEAQSVLTEIKQLYKDLPFFIKRDVAIISLPMASRKENALIVNALQRVSAIVIQNSFQEGFGLTVTEAMWKEVPIIGSKVKGIMLQVRDGTEGILINDPKNFEELSNAMLKMLTDKKDREMYGRQGHQRVLNEFTIISMLEKYVNIIDKFWGKGEANSNDKIQMTKKI